MAEIKIEKKKPIWPWVLLAVILIAVVAFFVFQEDVEDFADDVQEEINEHDTDDVDDVSTYLYQDYLDSLKPDTLLKSKVENTIFFNA